MTYVSISTILSPMATNSKHSIARLDAIRLYQVEEEVYLEQNKVRPGLYDHRILECRINRARLERGLDLTRSARGLPHDPRIVEEGAEIARNEYEKFVKEFGRKP